MPWKPRGGGGVAGVLVVVLVPALVLLLQQDTPITSSLTSLGHARPSRYRLQMVDDTDGEGARIEGAAGEGAKGKEKESINTYLPTIYVITPTYKRPEQIADLTRLGQTLLNVPGVHWIVAEDDTVENADVISLLAFLAMPYTYLLSPMPARYRILKFAIPRGVANRNAGLTWLRQHASSGVLYFADDDNAYDIRVFEEMRYTRRVSMWPVGLVTKFGVSSPVLRDGRFVGWYDGWPAGRIFPVDMASFAVSIQYLLTVPNATMPFVAGFEETGFLHNLGIKAEDIEFKAENCTKILVWHTKTKPTLMPEAATIIRTEYDGTNLRVLQQTLGFRSNCTKGSGIGAACKS